MELFVPAWLVTAWLWKWCFTLLRNVGNYSPSHMAWHPIRCESSVFVLTRFRMAVMWWRNDCRKTPPTAQNVSNGPPSRPWLAHMTSQQGSTHFLTSNHYICFTDVRHLIFHALFPCVSPTNYTGQHTKCIRNQTVDSSSIQCAESKYGLIIQFLALVVMIREVRFNV